MECTGGVLANTKALIRCNPGYTKPKGDVRPILTCLASGQWSHTAYKCEPGCGFLSEGTNVQEMPWHVGIYKNDEQICGGTIVAPRVVISAAHCFDNTQAINHKDYKVAAGEIKRNLQVAQISEIRDVQEIGILQK